MKNSKKWFQAQAVQTHPSVPRGIADFLSKRHSRVDVVIDLWGSDGYLLQAVLELTGARRGIGFYTDSESRNRDSSNSPRIRWEQPLIDGPSDQFIEKPDVVIGIPSQYWSPQHIYRTNSAGALVHLTEDPSNVAMIDACMQLSTDGVGIFMVGAGVLMRPGPGTLMAKLHEFGLSLEAIIEVPRGLVSPDRGAGQSLIAISTIRSAQPLLGRLNSTEERIDELIPQGKRKESF